MYTVYIMYVKLSVSVTAAPAILFAMSRSEGSKLKRFFVQSTEDVQKRLRILAIQMDSTGEKLGGVLLEAAVTRAEIELKAGRLPLPPKKPK